MKNLKQIITVVAMAIFMLSSFSGVAQSKDGVAQSTGKTKLYCITTSCCSVGFFTVEIWSQTTCHYVDVQERIDGSYNYSMSFETNEKNLEYLEVIEDMILSGMNSELGLPMFFAKRKI